MNCSPYFLLLIIFLTSLHLNGAYDEYVPFEQNYAPLWAPENLRILDQSREVQLDLDQRSEIWSGWFNMRIKMPQKDSSALQSGSDGDQDELDFEVLGGNNKDRPYLLNTFSQNVKVAGSNESFLWFDPTTNFHNYTLLWNQNQLVFLVDGTPIRVFKNTTTKGGSYPTKAMRIVATIWTSPWASHGAPVNCNDAPFEAHHRGFGLDACQNQNTSDQQ